MTLLRAPEARSGTAVRTRWILTVLAGVCLAVVVPGQLAWGAAAGHDRLLLTFVIVLGLFGATIAGAWLARGPRWTAAYLGVTLLGGWLIEAIGLATGWPFGDYDYTPALGLALLGVPLLIPIAWSMLAYPCLVAAERLTGGGRVPVALVGGTILASWDLFLDPQMVGEGYWVWHQVAPALPGIPGIPIQNYLAWWGVGIALVGAVAALPTDAPRGRGLVPAVQLSWVYVTNLVGAAFIFDRPGAALWGGAVMGALVVPWWISLVRRR